MFFTRGLTWPGNGNGRRPPTDRLVRFPPDQTTRACHHGPVVEDFERCYRAVKSRERRFDGWFVTAVRTTRIFCRPSCPARTPYARNVTFYPTAAAAQQAGYRACRRCRPDAAPGSPEWNGRADVVARAMRLIADGAVDRHGVRWVAARLGYSERQLHRLMTAELGTGPLAVARSQRGQSARVLLETTDLPMAQVAFSAGFASVRQFNDTVRAAFGCTPSELRRRRRTPTTKRSGETGNRITVRLAYREPFDAGQLLGFLGARAIPGVEQFAGGSYRRTMALEHGDAVVGLRPGPGHIEASFVVEDLRDLTAAVNRCRRLLDLDADPEAADATLGSDPLLGPLVAARPGLRVPGTTDPFELAVRAVCGQQVSVGGARTVVGRLVAAAGRPLRLAASHPGLTHTFPRAAALLEAPDGVFAMPASRREALRQLARAVAEGDVTLDAGAEPTELRRQLTALPGIGPWTADYVVMRGLSHPDTVMAGDLSVRRALEHLGAQGGERATAALAERWRPWRSYANVHLWASLADLSRPAKEDAA